MFFFICVWINGWVSNGEAGDLWNHRAHYAVTVMFQWFFNDISQPKSQSCMIILNVTNIKTHSSTGTYGFLKQLKCHYCIVYENSISVKSAYMKYIYSPCVRSMLCLLQNSMFFPWIFHFSKFKESIMKFNDFFPRSWNISKFQWSLRAVGTLIYGHQNFKCHYTGVIKGAMASQITSLAIVYSTVCSDADQRKNQSSASLAFVRGIHRWPVNSPHKRPTPRKMFPFDDVIMVWHWLEKNVAIPLCLTIGIFKNHII